MSWENSILLNSEASIGEIKYRLIDLYAPTAASVLSQLVSRCVCVGERNINLRNRIPCTFLAAALHVCLSLHYSALILRHAI